MDFSDTMYNMVKEVFPNASIVIDCFHIFQRVCDFLDEMRMSFKRSATSQTKQEEKEFKQKRSKRAKVRAAYRKKHPKTKAEKRGKPRLRTNEK